MSSAARRTILITGCSAGGAGYALTLEFAAQGMHVFATARSTKSLAQLEAKGIEVLPLEVTSAESIASLKAEVAKRTGGKLDILLTTLGSCMKSPRSRLTPVGSGRCSMSICLRCVQCDESGGDFLSDTLRIELAPLGIKVVILFMGEVSTGLMSADNISFGQDSLYLDVEADVKERSRHHEQKSMALEDFAQQVVRGVLSEPAIGRGEYLWKGTNAFGVWLLDSIGWRKIFDGIVKSPVGFDKQGTQTAIYNKGQHSVQHV